MSSYFPVSFISTNALEIALLFFVGGFFTLLRSLSTQDQFIREQRVLIADLQLTIQQCRSDLLQHAGSLDQLQDQCMSLLARQQLVEKHGSDAQRIDLAMRMLKRGNGDAETLQDLGLSASEIKLLTRLHSTPEASASGVKARGAKTPDSGAKKRVSKHAEPTIVTATTTSAETGSVKGSPERGVRSARSDLSRKDETNLEKAPLARQGKRLAKLFASTTVESVA